MKILFTGLDSANKVGGIETYIYKILSHINLKLFQIEFLAFKGVEPCFYKEFLALGCKFHFVTSRKKNCFRNKKEIRELLRRENFDIVHCHLNSLSYITPCVEASKLRIPVIVHSRNSAIIASRLSRILHHLNFFRLRFLPVTRVAVSDVAGMWMFGKKSFLVLNNGINTELYRFSEDARLSIRQELGVSRNTEVFVCVGAFRPQKNHHFLINIFAEYLKEKPEAILLLVGEGDLRAEIERCVQIKGIKNNVKFLGLRKDIPNILSAADKFLFPSFYEGFPNALIEAECCGLRCIVSDSITKQAVVNELCDMVSLKAPVEEWIFAMKKNADVKNRLSATNKIIDMGLDIESEIKRLTNLYLQLVNNR